MSVGEKVLDLLFPPKCPYCETILDHPRAPASLPSQAKLPCL